MERIISIEPSMKAEGQWIIATNEHMVFVFGAQMNKALGANLELILKILAQKEDYVSMLALLEGAEAELSVVEAAGTEYIDANGEIRSRKEDKLGVTKIVMPNYQLVLSTIMKK